MPEAPKVIAEIGCNHAGDMKLAEKLIHVAAHFCEADVVKFQKRNPRSLLTPEQYNAPHPNPMHAYGETYGAHREFLEFDREQHAHLQAVCRANDIDYSCSVWDLPSAHDIVSLEPTLIKIPSATNTHVELLDYVCAEFAGEIHVSLGMTDRDQELRLLSQFEERGRLDSLVLYACTSGYPVPFEDVCLLELSRLRSSYGDTVKAIGFSGHHLGIAADVAAETLGATWLERHFTLDRTMKGTDHAASLEPDGLRRLKRDTVAVAKALTFKDEPVLAIEKEQFAKLKWQGGNAGSTLHDPAEAV
jgi:sialic acid synthase